MDSAKVFANAKWTVEKAYGGNIGLQNAVNSIQGQLSKLTWIGTLGMATDTLTDRTRGDIRAELALNHHSIPVFVNDHDFEGHYHQFCKQVSSFFAGALGKAGWDPWLHTWGLWNCRNTIQTPMAECN